MKIPRPLKFVLSFALAAIVCCVLAGAWFFYQFKDWGGDGYDLYMDTEVPSPDKKHIATEYTISGGGAAGYVLTRIQIRPANQKFHATKRSDDFIFEISHADPLTINWKGGTQLVVTYEKGANVSRTAPTHGDIHISYVAKR